MSLAIVKSDTPGYGSAILLRTQCKVSLGNERWAQSTKCG